MLFTTFKFIYFTDAQLQANEDTPNFISPVILGSVAVVFFVITGAITCISFFVFRRFRPGKVGKFMWLIFT